MSTAIGVLIIVAFIACTYSYGLNCSSSWNIHL